MKPTLKTIVILGIFATSTAVLADEATNSMSQQPTAITPQQFTWDFDNARRRVHAMKPHLKFMGMKTAAGFAETIEQLCADQKDPAQVSEKFALVRSQCEQAIVELREKL